MVHEVGNSREESAQGGQWESEIRVTAHQIDEERRMQNTDGGELSDWLAAEAIVNTKHGRNWP